MILLALLAALPTTASEESAELIDTQRKLFLEVYPRAELGDWRPAAKHEDILQTYVLWPDLRAAWLRTRVRNHDYKEVDSFLTQYGILKPARELRYHYALTLGRQGNFADYLSIYEQFYQGLDVARLDCLGLQAEIDAGRQSRIVNRGVEHWLIGNNQVEECDPVFDHLRSTGDLNTDLYRQRFDLAIAKKELGIARYLARDLPTEYQVLARQWTAVVNDPEQFVSGHDPSETSAAYREQLIYAVERLGYRQPALAQQKWQEISDQYGFAPERRAAIERHIALWAARRHLPNAPTLLVALPDSATDEETVRWLIRSRLLASDWDGALSAVEELSDSERQLEEWRYWQAWLLQRSNNGVRAQNDVEAQRIFNELANERSYYGFLAADLLGHDYEFAHRPIAADEALIRSIELRPEIVRARELFLVGLESRGRSEWDAGVAMFTEQEKIQAAVLAHRWGWHSRAISTAASAGHLDDLDIRFPLAYRQAFESHSNTSNINDTWAYGIARSESLFMRDVRSSAGAIGIMQLMPETGRITARKISRPYSGQSTLTDPESNIRIGTAYLAMMLDRFDNNQVLATAAYNAGPLNVSQWLPETGDVDPQIWIENIPYNETRKYVRRVLASEIIFDWRLSGSWQRLTPKLPPVNAPSQAQQVALSP